MNKADELLIHDLEAGSGDMIAAAQRIRELVGENEWQPIETAPKDGGEVLAYGPHLGMLVVEYGINGGGWPWQTLDGPSYSADAFTHWRPLPPPPTEGEAT